MTPRDTLPAIPENKETKIRSSEEWNDEDADDEREERLYEREERLYELDNANVAAAISSIADADDDGEDTRGVNGENNGSVDDGVDPGPFYVQSATGEGSWELTWPIWHMLPRDERRAIAAQHGMKTIGEFEEYMSLAKAVDESEGVMVVGQMIGVADAATPNNNNFESAVSSVGGVSSGLADGSEEWHPPFIGDIEPEDYDDALVSPDEGGNPVSDGTSDEDVSSECIDPEQLLEMVRLGGLPCSIPDEILHRCFAYLPVDDISALALVSPHWKRFTRCESLYKSLCERIYLIQSKRKALHVSRFGNSYRKMLELRPRVRAGGGLYVLKYQEIRKIERDMWTEIPVGAILESVYYRYLYFFEDGRVMYALTHATPIEMIPRFSNMLQHGYGSKDKWGVWGRYQISKDTVRVWASQEWHDVCFQLKVIRSNRELRYYDTGDRGTCTTMKLEKHMSSKSGNFDDNSEDLVDYDIPTQGYFRYLRDRRL